MNQKHSVSVPEYGIQFSTGSLAKFANGAVVVTVSATGRDRQRRGHCRKGGAQKPQSHLSP